MAKKQTTAKKAPITKEMALGECLEKYPETMEVFTKYGLHCIGCVVAMHETIEQGAQMHGLNVSELVDALNEAVKKHKKEE
jgi:hybrid cluster-associated redox disulfide protein